MEWSIGRKISNAGTLPVITVLSVLPALFLLSQLLAPIPREGHHAREVAAYFQAYSFAVDGLQSYRYLVPAESSASLHFYSLVSAPLLESGYLQAGRLISLIAAIIAAVLTGVIATHLFDRKIGYLSVGFLWIHPLFVEFSSKWWPESIGLALTLGALYAALRVADDDSRGWFALSNLLLVLAITNHLWEATIAFPITVLYLYRRKFRYAVSTAIVTILSISVTEFVKSKQPEGHDLTGSYGIHTDPELLLTVDWLTKDGASLSGDTHLFFDIAVGVSVPITLLILSGILIATFRESALSFPRCVLGAWLVGGLSILILLPVGWIVHRYYLWGVLAPMAVGLGWVTSKSINHVFDYLKQDIVSRKATMSTLVILLLCTSSIYGGFVQEGASGAWDSSGEQTFKGFNHSEQVQAASGIEAAGATRGNELAFVGFEYREQRTAYWAYPVISKILIYSGVVVRGERSLENPTDDKGPVVVDELTEDIDCTVAIVADQNTKEITVTEC